MTPAEQKQLIKDLQDALRNLYGKCEATLNVAEEMEIERLLNIEA